VNLELSLNVVIVFPSAIHLPLKENVDKVHKAKLGISDCIWS
jgi:hypothetical protein